MRLIVARVAAARSLLTAAAAVALVATTLITLFLVLAWLQPIAAIRTAFTEAPSNERTILVTADAGSDVEVAADRDAAVRDLLEDDLAGVRLPLSSGGRAIGHRLPEAEQDTVIMFLEELPEHASLVEGAWPEHTAEDAAVQVAIPESVATELEVGAGDEVAVQDWVRQDEFVTQVVGVWAADDPADPYWELTAGRSAAGDLGPLVVDRGTFLDRFRATSTLLWLAQPDPSELALAGMDELVRAGEERQAQMIRERDEDPTWAPGTRMRMDLIDLAGRLELSTVVQRSGLVLPAALLAVIAVYALALLARLLATGRRGETALLRARGASRWQLARAAGAEALLVVAPAAVLSAPFATWIVAFMDATAGDASLELAGDLASFGALGPGIAWGVAFAAALTCAVALVVPAARRGRTWVAEQQERSRPRRGALLQRAGIDVALVVIAVLAWLQLRQYGAGVVPRDVGGIGVDPVLTMAPVIAVLAATVVALRLVPLVTRAVVRVVQRGQAFPMLLGAWQADRRPHAGPVVLLVLAVATAVLAPSVAATWQQSQRDQAAHRVGADVRLEGEPSDIEVARRVLEDTAQLEAAMAVERSWTLLGGAGRVPLLALESQATDEVVHLRADLGPEGAAATFAPLREGRATPPGLPLPDEAERLSGTVALSWEGEAQVMAAGVSTVLVATEDGRVSSVSLGRPTVDGSDAFDVALPEGATTLVGVRGEFRYRPGRSLEPLAPEEHDAVWELDDLVAHTGTGASQELDVPGSWELDRGPDWRPGPQRLTVELDPPGRVRLPVEIDRYGAQVVSFLLAEDVEVPVLPALFTDAALQAAGGEEMVGTEVDLGDVVVRIVDTMPSLPGTEQEAAVAVDLAWLSHHRARQLDRLPMPNELWIDERHGQQFDALAVDLGLDVRDRQAVAERLLDDPQGTGVLQSLWAAAVAAIALAAFGLIVDARATAVQRRRELAFLHILGASPPSLARALVVEQGLLAGLGVLAGIGVGLGVAITMGPSLIMTSTGAVPVPEPVADLSIGPFVLPTMGLFVTAVVLGALVVRRARREVSAGALRIGED